MLSLTSGCYLPNLLAETSRDADIGVMNKNRPAHVKPPAHLTPSSPVPTPEAAAEPTTEWGGPKGLEPVRYGDWENNGIAWDF